MPDSRFGQQNENAVTQPDASPPSAELAEEPSPAAFNRRLGFGSSTAVVIIDMCQAYFTEGSPLDLGNRSSIDGCVALVKAARAANLPVLWTRVEFEPGGSNGGVFYRKVGALESFDRGNPLADWLPELTPEANEAVITKQGASSFFGTDLADQLAQLGIDTLVMGGVSTSGCVRATALDACQHNFIPIVVPEACGDRKPATHEASLFDLDAKYADVEPLEAVLSSLGA